MHLCACARMCDAVKDIKSSGQSHLEREGIEGPFVLSVLQCIDDHLKSAI